MTSKSRSLNDIQTSKRILCAFTAIAMILSIFLPNVSSMFGSVSVSAEDTFGELKVDSFSIAIGDDMMTDGITVKDGDDVVMSFEWAVDNNSMTPIEENGRKVYKYRTAQPVDVKGIDLKDKDGNLPKGVLYGDEAEIGSYRFEAAEDGSGVYVVVELYEEAFDLRSDIGGGIRLEGELALDTEKKTPNNSNALVGFGDVEYNVIYDDGTGNGKVSISKSHGSVTLGEDGLYHVTYTVKATLTGMIYEVDITDTPDAALTLVKDSITVNDTKAASQSFPIKARSSEPAGSKNKNSKETITVKYEMTMTEEDYHAKNSSEKIKNEAAATYTDDSGQPQVVTDNDSIDPIRPTVDKSVVGRSGITFGSSATLTNKTTNSNDTLEWVSGTTGLTSGEIKYPKVNYSIKIDTKKGSPLSEDELKAMIMSMKDQFISTGSSYMTKDDWVPYCNSYTCPGEGLCRVPCLAHFLYKYDGDLSKLTDSDWAPLYSGKNSGEYGLKDNGDGTYTLTYSIVIIDPQLMTYGNKSSGTNSWQGAPIENRVTVTVNEQPITDVVDLYLDIGINLLAKDIELDPATDWSYGDGNVDYNGAPSYVQNRDASLKAGRDLSDVDFTGKSGPSDVLEQDGILEVPHRIRIRGEDFMKWYKANYDAKTRTVQPFVLHDVLNGINIYQNNGGFMRGGEDRVNTAEPYNGHHYIDSKDFFLGFTVNLCDPDGNSQQTYFPGAYNPSTSMSIYSLIRSVQLTNHIEGTKYSGVDITIDPQTYFHGFTYSDRATGETIPKDIVITYYTKVKMVENTDPETKDEQPYVLDPTLVGSSGYKFINSVYVESEVDDRNMAFGQTFNLHYPNVETPPSFSNISKGRIDTLTSTDGTISFKDDNSPGWYLNLPISALNEDDKLVITDTLPDDLTYKSGSMTALFAASTPSSPKYQCDLGTRSLSDFALDSSSYTVTASGQEVKITITITKELLDKAEELGRSNILFAFSTSVDMDKIVKENYGKNSSVSIKNTAVCEYNGTNKSPVTNTQSINIPKVASKTVEMDSELAAKKHKVYATYTLDINAGANDLVTGDTLLITDTMPNTFAIDKSTISVTDAEGNALDGTKWSYQAENAYTVKFTVPDNMHLKIVYSAYDNIDPVEDPLWYTNEKTNNKFTIEGFELDEKDSEADLAKFAGYINAWVYSTNGSITVSKFTKVGDVEQPLSGAIFNLYSVYDNLGSTDKTLVKENIVIPESGSVLVDDLPLDRVYKLVETKPPTGYESETNKAYYFVLETNSPLRIKVKDPRDVYEAYAKHKGELTDEEESKLSALEELVKEMNEAGVPRPINVFEQDNGTVKVGNYKAISIEVTKNWDDEGKEAYRPSEITVELYRTITPDDNNSWVKIDEATINVTAEKTQTHTFENLAARDSESNVYYYKAVENAKGYTAVYNYEKISEDFPDMVFDDQNEGKTAKIEITNQIETTTLEATKTWIENTKFTDDFVKDHVRPESITIHVMCDTTDKEIPSDIYTVKWITTGDKWKVTVSGLPKYVEKDGVMTEAEYHITEGKDVPDGYVESADTNGGIINTYETMDITYTKIWEDQPDKMNIRPKNITLTLTETHTKESKNYTTSDAGVEVSESGNEWTITIKDLPAKVRADGKLVDAEYTVFEQRVQGYNEPVIDQAKKTITNTYETTEVTIEKQWAGEGAVKGKYRPNTVSVELYADGKLYSTYEIKPDDKLADTWQMTISDLPKINADGEEVEYTVKEVSGTAVGYISKTNGLSVTNTLDTVTLNGTKNWVGDSEAKGNRRPESIDIEVYGNNALISEDEYTLEWGNYDPKADDSWNFTITGLPRVDTNGDPIDYTVKEVGIGTDILIGYTDSYDFSNAENPSITNSYETPVTEINGHKRWVNDTKYPDARPSKITVELYADGRAASTLPEFDGIETVKEVSGTGDIWDYNFTALPAYYNDGSLITYSVKEVEAEKGTLLGYRTNIYGFDISNTFVMEKVELSGTKTWVNDSFAVRPTQDNLTLTLYADGEAMDNEPVWISTNTNVWEYKFVDLDKYKYSKDAQGNITRSEIVYTVKETAVPSMYYMTQKEGTNDIVNTRIQQVNIVKRDDEGNVLAGAVLQILDDKGNKIEQWESGSTVHVVTGLSEGRTYTLKELSAPNGYLIADPIEFTVSSDGSIVYVDMTDVMTEVSIAKTDSQTGKPLAGAKLSLTDKDGNVIDEWESEESEHIISGLTAGESYTLTEVSAPDGYSAAEPITFTVDTENKLTKVEMKDSKTITEITKTNADGEMLEGAELIVKDRNGKTVDSWVSGKEAHVIEGLKAGEKYTLSEVKAPNGYYLAKDITFTVNSDNSVTKVEMTDAITEVKVSKQDGKTGEELKGAKLTVTDSSGSVIDEWTTDGSIHSIFGLTVGESYILTEVSAPDGYDIAESVQFMIPEDPEKENLIVIKDNKTIVIDSSSKEESSSSSVPDSKVEESSSSVAEESSSITESKTEIVTEVPNTGSKVIQGLTGIMVVAAMAILTARKRKE